MDRGDPDDQSRLERAEVGPTPEASGAPGDVPGEAPNEADRPRRETGDDTSAGASRSMVLPEAVRQRVIALASETLDTLPADRVPAALRPVAKFTRSRRARLAATPLATVLESDPVFRSRVGERLSETMPELVAAVFAGDIPAVADPQDIAAAAYLLRPTGWTELVAGASDAAREAELGSVAEQAERDIARLREELAAARARGRREAEEAHAEADTARRDAEELRRRVRQAEAAARRAETAARRATEELERFRLEASEASSATATELRRVRARLAAAERALEASRRAAREGRGLADTRLRLLLDTLVESASGLRRELAVPPTEDHPADLVEAVRPGQPGTSDVPVRARGQDDPRLLDEYLSLPQVHLIIDGYNVTKTGYPHLTLREQRMRLLGGLAVLAARTRAEVTCVFDGAALDGPVPLAAPRGVRVLFSPAGEVADELIRRLVAAEPPGRPVVVVSSDREVAEGVRRSGAHPVPSTMLLRRLAKS